jgi:hypothetical protein
MPTVGRSDPVVSGPMAASSPCATCGRDLPAGEPCPDCDGSATEDTDPVSHDVDADVGDVEEATPATLPPPDPGDARPSPQPDTQPIDIIPPRPPDQPDAQPSDAIPPPPDQPDTRPSDAIPPPPDQTDQPDTEPVEIIPVAAGPATGVDAGSDAAVEQPTGEHELVTAETAPVAPPAPVPTPTSTPAAPVTATVPVTTLQPVGVVDLDADEFQHTSGRHPFRVGLLLVLSLFGALAAVMVPAADIVDIRTTRPIDGIGVGIITLDDIGTNLAVAAYVGAGAMVFGAILGSFGFRWGAGIAGGAGLALIGWAGITLGLAEVPITQARTITRQNQTQEFTLTVTRDVGYWLVVGVAALGLLVFLASLRSSGRGGRRGLDPWIAALGALASLGIAVGPLIPVNDASFSDNFQSSVVDLPTLYFLGRLTQLALIALAGVVGFLLVRAYGLGLAAGGISVAVWMWFSSASQIGDKPIGIGIGNFGSRDTDPHAVTTVALVATVVILLAAATMATIRYSRERSV